MDYSISTPKYCICSICNSRVLTENMAYYKPDIIGTDFFPTIKSICTYKCVHKVLDVMIEKTLTPKANKKNYGWIKRNIISISPKGYSAVKCEEIIFLCGIITD